MLNDIRVHIHQNEQQQEAIEQRSAAYISETIQQNRLAFARHIPSLNGELDAIRSDNISIFCNKNEEYNIVDFGLGRTLYGEQPGAEILRQCQHFAQHSAILSFAEDSCPPFSASESEQEEAEQKSASMLLQELKTNAQFVDANASQSDVLVILGLGLGQHVDFLVNYLLSAKAPVKHIIIYEPEAQYFKSACMVKDWRILLELIQEHDIGLYFQLGKDASTLVQDLNELKTHFPVKQALVYQHYYAPAFDTAMHAIRSSTWEALTRQQGSFSRKESFQQYTQAWALSQNVEELVASDCRHPQFVKNLAAFKQYYPNIHAEFERYQPVSWSVVENKAHEINLLNHFNGACFYGPEPKQDGLENYQSFEKNPNKDGLILGYNGQKLKHYLHYRMVKKTERLLAKAEDEAGMLPDTIKSLILFGLGAGYELESLLDNREVEKLFICEPNRDYFYASLYAIDWAGILQKIDAQGANLYINIGDDGTNLFRDLLGQFYNIGPYVLSQTFFYQGYYNASLNAAIVQLREQLQIVVSMGEYFDHACFAIEHTKEALRKNVPFLKAKPSQYLNTDEKELPILFVGNGPSLDYSLETIRELQEQAIVISCGTSLQVLHRNNIVPDFHAEIELNRATYDWACRVNDPAYLKKITLLSCNGIHPDTCDLYKDVMIAFKEGESATVSALNVIGEDKAESLAFAFPTVSNFAINLFLRLGFHQFYLFGVDMGFVDSTQHHSAQSGYYDEKGKEMYKYAEANNTGLLVPGNFRSVVNTKHEFKLAKTIIEQALASQAVDCYNTSDGARIEGTSPLDIDNILLMTSPELKSQTLQTLQSCFCHLPEGQFNRSFDEKYDMNKLQGELSQLNEMLNVELHNQDDIFEIVEKQKQFLFYSYKQGNSLFFYYLYGSMNYINSVLSKAAMHQNRETALEVANEAILIWQDLLCNVKLLLSNPAQLFDTSSSFTLTRERFIKAAQASQDIHFIIFDDALKSVVDREIQELSEIYPLQALCVDGNQILSGPKYVAENATDKIILVNGRSQWQAVTELLYVMNVSANACNRHNNILICIACDYEPDWISSASHFEHLQVGFQVLPSLLESSDLEKYRQGEVPFAPLKLHLESAINHLGDLDKQLIFIQKLDFSELGLKNALYSILEHVELDDAASKDPVLQSAATDDETRAFAFIKEIILNKVACDGFVDYKNYIAIPRQTSNDNKDESSQHATELDSVGSRGLKIARQLSALEVFQNWQKHAVVEKNIGVYQKAK
jgi:hypothetical protein